MNHGIIMYSKTIMYVSLLDVFFKLHQRILLYITCIIHLPYSLFTRKPGVGSQLWQQPPQEGFYLSGDVTSDSLITPRLLRVWNKKDTGWFPCNGCRINSLNAFFNHCCHTRFFFKIVVREKTSQWLQH